MNPQEAFWAGKFGDEYAERNKRQVGANINLFSRILRRTHGIKSVLELGCGTGQNLLALNAMMPHVEIYGVEINKEAAKMVPFSSVIAGQSFLDPGLSLPETDLVFTKGVLIHIAPEDLPAAYLRMYNKAKRYIVMAEYYNPIPVEVEYRGHSGRLWKRDFAEDMLLAFPDLRLIDYGFVYHADPNWPQDDITWFLMEKTQ